MTGLDWSDALNAWLSGTVQCWFAVRLNGRRCPWWLPLLYGGVLFAVSGAGIGVPGAGLAAGFLILFALLRRALKIPAAAAAAASGLALTLAALSGGIVSSALSLLIPELPLPLPSWPPAAGVAVSVVLTGAVCGAALHLASLDGSKPASLLVLLCVPAAFVLGAELLITDYFYSTVSTQPDASYQGRHVVLLVLQAAGLGAVFCMLAAYRRLVRATEDARRLASLSQARDAERTRHREAQARLARMRSIRHDWKSHLRTLSGLLRRGETSRAFRYLGEIDAAVAETEPPVTTGNAVVDVLLAEKAQAAEASGITFETEPFQLPDGVLDDFDLCVIFSNALDNALAACREAPGDRFIALSASRQGSLLALSFRNRCAPGALPPPGTGLGNIRSAAERYGGGYILEKKGTEALLRVLLSVPEPPRCSS